MLTFALIGLIAGLITGVSPCVLPMLPVVFFVAGAGQATTTPSRRRALMITAGLVVGFSFFALLGTTLVRLLGLPDSILRWGGATLLAVVGLGMLIPPLGHLLERPFSRLPKVTGQNGSPFVLGLGLATLYVPCAGPVLAAIIVAGSSGPIGAGTVVMTVFFALGAALPLVAFATAGERIRDRIAAYRSRAQLFRVVGGAVLIALALALSLNVTSVIQRAVPNYTKPLEDRLNSSDAVQGALTPFETDENRLLSRCTPGADELERCGPAPRLRGTGQWFNTPGEKPVTLSGLRGRVVLLDFFAYSCINCQRDQPYLQKWASTYEDAGLTVVGVHSPEFAFERNAQNLAASLRSEGTTYPVVQDNDLATWTAYRNRYWPAKYLVDRDGTVRAITFGEGGYSRTESLIRELLSAGPSGRRLPASVTNTAGTNLTSDRTPELYVADNRAGYVGTPTYIRSARAKYSFAAGVQPRDTYGLSGRWASSRERMTAVSDAKLRLHFRATKVFHVLGGNGTVTITQPGKADRVIRVAGPPNLHQLVSADHVLDATITLIYSSGVQAYTFTFG
jgi:cytochrome c biogenesis protein CcdA/thiol-disulfide isomerase/thioredoxin